MIMTTRTRVRKPPIRLELGDELSPHQITGSVPFSDTAFSLLSCSILASHLSLSRGPQSKQTDYSVPLHQQAIWDLFLEILDWTMGAVFPNHIKNDSQWQSSQQEPFFSPWMNKWNWLHFGWPAVESTYCTDLLFCLELSQTSLMPKHIWPDTCLEAVTQPHPYQRGATS